MDRIERPATILMVLVVAALPAGCSSGAPDRGRPGDLSAGDRGRFRRPSGVVVVAAGDRVTWVNRDAADHTVTAESEAFGSEPFGAGQAFSARMERAGTFRYICSIHPAMTGRITVTR